ncbi:aminoglycoside phosphotransferase family protein [Actinoplanes sp. NPDC051470]|uniref:aminoglycoside phosphotransferase family protein n=1 Tax=Actinoplanes sp. NPDC051470 TaxID=3157224 RepID=UPI00342E2604
MDDGVVGAVIDVPAAVVAKARLADAQGWLDGLPALVDELSARWGLTTGRVFGDGTEAYVVEATRADGTPAVLKLVVPRLGNDARDEITVLRLAAGEGCARLLAADEGCGALLLERLGRSLYELERPLPERLVILAGAARKVWRPATGLRSGAEKGRWLIEFVRRRWVELDRPCAERTVEHAIAAAGSRVRAHDPERAVLVHGDVHQWNALEAGDGFKLVDPDGLIAEPEYDLGVLMREDPVELMSGDPWDRAHRLAEHTGTDATAIWEWGVVERVSTGLVLAGIGLQPLASEMLGAADEISRRAG